MTFAEALRGARSLISSRKTRFICMALSMVGGAEHCHRVSSQLNGCVCYESWTLTFHPDVRERMTSTDFRAGRLQWIDHMISEEVKAGRA